MFTDGKTEKPNMGSSNSMDDKDLAKQEQENERSTANDGHVDVKDSHKELAAEADDVRGRRNGSESDNSRKGQ